VSTFLPFYFTAYIFGFLFAHIRRLENSRRLRGITPSLIGACLAFWSYSESATAQYGASAALYIVFFAVAIPWLIFGLGSLLTSAGSYLPSTALGNSIKTGLVSAPVVFVAFAMHEANQRRHARQLQEAEQQALFQMSDVEGMLSGFALVLPASPQIDLYHDCDTTGPSSKRTCRTFFATAVRLRVDNTATTPVQFSKLVINPTNLQTKSWCGKRPEMEDRVWCNDLLDHQIRFSANAMRAPDENWTEIPDAPDSLRIFCQDRWDGFVCQSHHVVSPDVYVRGWFDDVVPSQIVPIAVDLQGVSDLIWQDIAHRR
jgi:hypothetical protein